MGTLWAGQGPHSRTLLRYEPHYLHACSLLPVLRSTLSATVIGRPAIHLQAVALLAWCAVLHATGLGLATDDLHAFATLASTRYQGAFNNFNALVVLMLAFFVSAVVQRFLSAAEKYRSLCDQVVTLSFQAAQITLPSPAGPGANERAEDFGRVIVRHGCLACVLALEEAGSGGAGLAGARNPQTGAERPQPSRSELDLLRIRKLATGPEVDLLRVAEASGCQKYVPPLVWASGAVDASLKASRCTPPLATQIRGSLADVAKLAAQTAAGSRAQLPFPYVALVSLTTHIYLFVVASYYGALLHAGMPEFGDGAFGFGWMSVSCYAFLVATNLILQGCLDLQSILDTPFGPHPAHFPARTAIVSVLNTTRYILKQRQPVDAPSAPATPRSPAQDRTRALPFSPRPSAVNNTSTSLAYDEPRTNQRDGEQDTQQKEPPTHLTPVRSVRSGG
ncbi:unnamed protein product [Pedinophyceae sp. YPF-701]|nr:unnamed protein product [Pedinophyceae sp. YPF-701]